MADGGLNGSSGSAATSSAYWSPPSHLPAAAPAAAASAAAARGGLAGGAPSAGAPSYTAGAGAGAAAVPGSMYLPKLYNPAASPPTRQSVEPVPAAGGAGSGTDGLLHPADSAQQAAAARSLSPVRGPPSQPHAQPSSTASASAVNGGASLANGAVASPLRGTGTANTNTGSNSIRGVALAAASHPPPRDSNGALNGGSGAVHRQSPHGSPARGPGVLSQAASPARMSPLPATPGLGGDGDAMASWLNMLQTMHVQHQQQLRSQHDLHQAQLLELQQQHQRELDELRRQGGSGSSNGSGTDGCLRCRELTHELTSLRDDQAQQAEQVIALFEQEQRRTRSVMQKAAQRETELQLELDGGKEGGGGQDMWCVFA